MEAIVRTVYGANLQTAQLLGIPFEVVPNSTLNDKFNASNTVGLSPADMPRMQYVAIGNGGHRMKVTGTGTLQVPEPIQHRTTDAALYSHLPFVLRPIGNDLTASERERYALRRLEQYNGEDYFAYYLRRMDLTGVNAQMEYKTVVGDVTTTTPFTPTAGNLSPTPPVVVTGGSVTTSGDYVTASAIVYFNLDSFDVAEILNACNIIYGSEDFAIISEIGLCSGVDKVVNAFDSVGSTFNFNEVIAAQIVSHISSFHALRFTSAGVNTMFDVGATEPLWLLT